jgi:hypothetical protein
MKAIKIWFLKGKAKRLLKAYYAGLDEYGCGEALALEMSPTLFRIKENFNQTLDKLADLDESTPKSRL